MHEYSFLSIWLIRNNLNYVTEEIDKPEMYIFLIAYCFKEFIYRRFPKGPEVFEQVGLKKKRKSILFKFKTKSKEDKNWTLS